MKITALQYTGLRPVDYATSLPGVASVAQSPPQSVSAVQVHLGMAGQGDDLNYTHQQGVPSDVWLIEHNLGKYPSVTVVDSSGAEVEGDVDRSLGLNQLRVTFSGAFSGFAYLN